MGTQNCKPHVLKDMCHSLKNSFHVKIPLKNVPYSLCTLFLPVELTYEEIYISSLTNLAAWQR